MAETQLTGMISRQRNYRRTLLIRKADGNRFQAVLPLEKFTLIGNFISGLT